MIHSLPVNRISVFSVSFSPDGRFLSTAGNDPSQGEVVHPKVWDMMTGKEAFEVDPIEGPGVLLCLAYHPDGKRLVAAGSDGELKVWNGVNGKKIGVAGKVDFRETDALVFSPDGRYLATANNNGRILIWNGTRLDTLQPPESEIQGGPVSFSDSIAFGPDSRKLIVCSGDDSATIWDVPTHRQLGKIEQQGHGFNALDFSPDGLLIASGGSDCTVRIWDGQSFRLLKTLRGHQGIVTRLRFVQLPGGLHLVSGSWDGTVKFWDAEQITPDRPSTR